MAPSTNSSTDPPVARQTLPEALTSPSDTQKREKSSTGIFPKRSALVSICNAMVSNLDLKSVLETILSVTLAEMRAQEGSVLLFNESQDRLEMLAALGLPEEIARRGYIPRKGSIAEWVIENDKPTIINGDVQSKNFSAAGRGRFIVSAMCVPLRASGKVIGTINLNRTDPEAGVFQKRDTDAMVILGSQAAVSIENSRLHEAIMRGERLAAIGQTVAGISHCMKNLLTSLKGGLSICEMGIEKQDWKLESQGMDILRRGIKRVSALALDMLDYSKERVPNCSKVNLEDMAKDILAMTDDTAAKKKNLVVFDFEEEARFVWGDYDQLFRCLLNLVQNGLDANEEGGSVKVSSRRETTPEACAKLAGSPDAAIVIRVEDSGHGIPEELISKLFEPFFSTKGSKGTGLGLAVTRKIIREHGGTLDLASKPAEPAIFAIYLNEAKNG